uniref:Uncharacterized protein n=1 Tax=Cucumis melo TaxID=3656 RepID=A0A9I9E8H4_CUCME
MGSNVNLEEQLATRLAPRSIIVAFRTVIMKGCKDARNNWVVDVLEAKAVMIDSKQNKFGLIILVLKSIGLELSNNRIHAAHRIMPFSLFKYQSRSLNPNKDPNIKPPLLLHAPAPPKLHLENMMMIRPMAIFFKCLYSSD